MNEKLSLRQHKSDSSKAMPQDQHGHPSRAFSSSLSFTLKNLNEFKDKTLNIQLEQVCEVTAVRVYAPSLFQLNTVKLSRSSICVLVASTQAL